MTLLAGSSIHQRVRSLCSHVAWRRGGRETLRRKRDEATAAHASCGSVEDRLAAGAAAARAAAAASAAARAADVDTLATLKEHRLALDTLVVKVKDLGNKLETM